MAVPSKISKCHQTLITMSSGMSMVAWQQAGIIDRELSYYKELSHHIGFLSFISYGDSHRTETKLLKQHIPDANIIWTRPPVMSQLPINLFWYTFLPPFNCKPFDGVKRVRSNQISGAWPGVIVAQHYKVPFILRAGYLLSKNIRLDKQAHTIKKNILILLEKWVSQKADAIIVTYAGAKTYLSNQYGICPSKITIIGNPIDTGLFYPQSQPRAKKRDVLYIGRLVSEKNIQSILLAIQKAKASITLLGKGPLKQEMIDLSRSLHLDVKFIDSLPNPKIPELMSKHRLFIIASHYEGNPKVLLEAMACEMPCIASNIPEHADIIENEKEGLLVPAIPGALSQAINRLLDAPDLGKEMGRRARNKILNHYSLKSNALKESQVYQAFSKKKNTC